MSHFSSMTKTAMIGPRIIWTGLDRGSERPGDDDPERKDDKEHSRAGE